MTFDDFLKQACPPLDLGWRKYRRRAARHRVQERMEELGIEDFADYLERLRSDPEEAEGLADRMLVTVTRFFRERERWRELGETVLPELLGELPAEGTLQAWSVGCCGGEEPYTLALLWRRRLQEKFPGRSLSILATDIDEASLERAEEAVYRESSLKEVPGEILARWFRRRGELLELDPEVRRGVRFERHNFTTDPLPAGMDLVLARYLPFTYYRGERRRAAVERLHRALRPGGALMIGRKEALGLEARELFEPWPGAQGVFRRRGQRTARS